MQSTPVPPGNQHDTLARFDALLRASSSATRMLEAWMAERHGVTQELTAHIRAFSAPALDAAIMQRLRIQQWSEIRYRRVWLASKGRVLSVAENWYVPARLDDAMAERLDDGATPFGAVIAPLEPTRETLGVERLWDGSGAVCAGAMPTAMLRHRALVCLADGTPLCEVSEIYTRNIVL